MEGEVSRGEGRVKLIINYQMTGCIGGCDNRINELLLECNRRSINQFFAPSTRAPASSDQLGRSYPFFRSFAFLFVLSLSFFISLFVLFSFMRDKI